MPDNTAPPFDYPDAVLPGTRGEIFLKTVLINIIAEITNLFMPVFTITCIAANRIYTKAIRFIAFVFRRRITFVNIVAFISHGMIPSDALALI